MNRPLVVVVAAVAAVGIGIFALAGRGRSKHGASAPAGAGEPGGTAATPAPVAGTPVGKLPSTPAPPPTPPPPPQALDREVEVRTKVDRVLDQYPDVAKVRNVECQPTGACKIEVEVDDLNNFRAPLELLQDPEGGLAGDHALMILSKPVPLGPNNGPPLLFTFQVTPPEGGVVKP